MSLKCLALVVVISLTFYVAESADNDVLNSVNIKGTNCKITDPVYNVTFDLNGLRSDLAHKVPGDKNDFIELNVCGSLIKTCDGKTNVGACYTKDSKEHIIGIDSEIFLTNGRLHYNFTGDKCDNKTNYSLQVILRCVYAPASKPLVLISYKENQCTFYIIWDTNLACLPLPEALADNSCSVNDKKTGHTFNLMPLSHNNQRLSDRNGSVFIINICKPVLYGHEETCPPGSSVCFYDKKASDLRRMFINYGSTAAEPIYENGKLMMQFTSDEKCSASQNFSSSIVFNCDTSTQYGEPEFLGKIGCEFSFVWPTAMACNSEQNCTTVDSITGFVYDLHSLAEKSYKVEHDNHSYVFGICNSAKNPCLDNAGACQIDGGQSTALGLFNANLMFNVTGAPYLIYRGGSVCKRISQQWTTKIEFICAKPQDTPGPKIVENTDCEIVIHFLTDLACQKQISCQAYNVSDGTEIDFSPLMNFKYNYLALVNDSLKATQGPPLMYYLNICKPLVPQFGLSCPGGSAACQAKNETSTPSHEKSLGYADVPFTVVYTEHGSRAQLKYLRGSVCPADPDTELSSVIEFYCDVKAGKGLPILQEVLHDCQYKFDWPTNVICPTHSCEFREKTCEIHNDQLGVAINLMNLTDNGKITVSHKPESFDINVCGNNRKVETDYAKGTVRIFFDTKGPCEPENSINVELRLVCKDTEAHYSSSDTYLCGLVLIKETPRICPFVGVRMIAKEKPNTTNATNTDDQPEVVSGGISILGVVFMVIILAGVIIANIIIFKNPVRRAKIKSLFRRRNVSVQYTRVRSNEEANLLLAQTENLSDSDDELLI